MNKLPTIDVPSYDITIPSTNEQIQFRPYLVKEEKLLLIALESDDANNIFNAIADICSACSFGKFNSDRHTEFDLEYFFINLRARSVGEEAIVEIECTECTAGNQISIDLTNIDPPVVDNSESTINLTDNVHIVVKYPTIDRLIRHEQSTTGQNLSSVDYMFAKVALHIDQIHYGDEIFHTDDTNLDQVIDFLGDLPSAVYKEKITTFFEEIPKVSHTAEFTCNSCQHENSREITGYQNFFA